jgi:hypothetical protein
MKINPDAVRICLKSFDFATLFREHLGWDKHQGKLEIAVDGVAVSLTAIAEKRMFQAFLCPTIPDRATRLKIDRQVTKSAHEHFVIYCDQSKGQQVWHWVRREPGKPIASRDHRFDASQSGDRLIQRLEQIAVSLDEDESLTLLDVTSRNRAAFDVDRVTKKFYEQFQDEHDAFLNLIRGIKNDADLQWYTSLMLNRLMFVYFIQKKGFLDGDTNYLRHRLQMVRDAKGSDKFHSFYRYFLLRLFHDGLGKSPEDRKLDPAMEKLLGKVPYLNGGFFEVHQLEERNDDIDIPDKAFEKLFDFFERFSWHLDDRPLRAENEINPDVVGYIFEKYINQKQMGAYYTKEDITEYISKNTVVPFLFDAAEKKCPIAFKEGGFIWQLLRSDPDRYIYDAVRHGVIDAQGAVISLPKEIENGVIDVSRRDGWNRPASDRYALATETWREHVARRERCLALRNQLKSGEVHSIHHLVTLNLDLWQFARDAIVTAEGPELVRAFWEAIERITVLDPTCGSGAFLFAALRILETLYSDCLERMQRFVEELAADPDPRQPEPFKDFRATLAQIDRHPNERYFILKSIIINNLFGVDLMEEAVEICKLRLFLKLVAQVDEVAQIEPLPDIDFNIRTGNTLVGYATKEDARKAFTEAAGGQGKLMLGDSSAAYQRFEEDVESVERAFSQFRAQQTVHGGKITLRDKQELRSRLAKLDVQLDRYLAVDYGVKSENKSNFEKWRGSHRPFHWFVEFYGIMRADGFDVIVGNPPYVEYRNLHGAYTVRGFTTLDCGDLYAFCVERSLQLVAQGGHLGLIVPISIFGTDGFRSLQQLATTTLKPLWVSFFANRPSQLFDGAQKRLTILIGRRSDTDSSGVHTTRYFRWKKEEFDCLFKGRLEYAPHHKCFSVFPGSLEKVGSAVEVSAFNRITAAAERLAMGVAENTKNNVYYTRKFGYFLAFLDFVPRITEIKTGKRVPPTELKALGFHSKSAVHAVVAALSSSTLFWFWNVLSDCRNLNRRDLLAFTFDPDRLPSPLLRDLSSLGESYVQQLKKSSRFMEKSGLRIETFDYSGLKPLIDRIDAKLAQHYGFTGEELDFIINYDIKYRIGAEVESDDE